MARKRRRCESPRRLDDAPAPGLTPPRPPWVCSACRGRRVGLAAAIRRGRIPARMRSRGPCSRAHAASASLDPLGVSRSARRPRSGDSQRPPIPAARGPSSAAHAASASLDLLASRRVASSGIAGSHPRSRARGAPPGHAPRPLELLGVSRSARRPRSGDSRPPSPLRVPRPLTPPTAQSSRRAGGAARRGRGAAIRRRSRIALSG